MKMIQHVSDRVTSFFLHLIVMVFPVLMIPGCASPEFQSKGGCVHNKTGFPIEQVIFRVVEDRKEVSCSYIGPGGFFSIQLPVQTYMEKPVEISWTCRGESYRTDPFVIPIPDPVPVEPAVVVVQIFPEGEAFAELFPASKVAFVR